MPPSSSERFVRTYLKVRHLVLLMELGRHDSIHQAGTAAELAQPAASKLVSALEHALGVKLFERSGRGIVATLYGEVMVRRASAALAEIVAGHQEVMELRSGLSGKVMIGSVMAPAATLVPRALIEMKRRWPRLQIALTVDTSQVLLGRLLCGELDLMIGRVSQHADVGELCFEALIEEPHCVIVRTGHPLLARDDLQLADLAQEAWILPPAGSILRERLTSLFLSQGLEQPLQIIETMSLPAIAGLMTASDMVVALPPELVKVYLDAGWLTIVPFNLGIRMDALGIITRKHHVHSPSAQAMLEMLRTVSGSCNATLG